MYAAWQLSMGMIAHPSHLGVISTYQLSRLVKHFRSCLSFSVQLWRESHTELPEAGYLISPLPRTISTLPAAALKPVTVVFIRNDLVLGSRL